MEKFTNIKGIAAPMLTTDGNQFSMMINVDTDMIIPKQFLKTIKRTGLGKNLFHEMRYDYDDNEIENFFLMDDKEVLKRIENDSDFKPNSKLVTLDFLIRKKLLDSEKSKLVKLFFSQINRKF